MFSLKKRSLPRKHPLKKLLQQKWKPKMEACQLLSRRLLLKK